jgi:hypothetical protein
LRTPSSKPFERPSVVLSSIRTPVTASILIIDARFVVVLPGKVEDRRS